MTQMTDLARVNAATTRADLDALALEFMGLESVDHEDSEDTATSLEDARDILRADIEGRS